MKSHRGILTLVSSTSVLIRNSLHRNFTDTARWCSHARQSVVSKGVLCNEVCGDFSLTPSWFCLSSGRVPPRYVHTGTGIILNPAYLRGLEDRRIN